MKNLPLKQIDFRTVLYSPDADKMEVELKRLFAKYGLPFLKNFDDDLLEYIKLGVTSSYPTQEVLDRIEFSDNIDCCALNLKDSKASKAPWLNNRKVLFCTKCGQHYVVNGDDLVPFTIDEYEDQSN